MWDQFVSAFLEGVLSEDSTRPVRIASVALMVIGVLAVIAWLLLR